MSYGNLLYALPEELRGLFRRYENYSKKLINLEWSIKFNSICNNEDILPNYSRLRHHDPAVALTGTTLKYRKYLVERELQSEERKLVDVRIEKEECYNSIVNFECEHALKNSVDDALQCIIVNHEQVVKTRTIKKLNSLYYGRGLTDKNQSICIRSDIHSFINLSSHQLSPDEIQFLNLGLNCHIQPKYDKLFKLAEIESLYQSLLRLEGENAILIKPELADQLRCESTKHRNTQYTSVLTPALRAAANKLKNNKDIVIRKADKSSVYVILNRNEYLDKLNSLLQDETKFKCIKKDPTNSLKQKANQLIEALNAATDDIKLNKIIGDYKPGYIYGNVKTHKANNPLRPIISQIPIPTYTVATALTRILSPYISKEYLLKSTNDFVDLLQSNQCNGIIASLDVESLFTNVPVDATIEIIIHNAYNHPSIRPPKIPKLLLKQLLELCTKEAPFKCPEGKIYVQIEGVAMGSPLGPMFANYYMGEVEQRVFSNKENVPSIYARYVDDIFVQVDSEEQLVELKQLFQNNSILNFTYEMNVNSKLPFLDVLVDTSDKKFHTTVYRKPTDAGNCLNAKSECVDKYKNSVIASYLNRAYKVTESWHDFHQEVMQIKQILINNNYSNRTVDEHVSKFVSNKMSTQSKQQSSTPVRIYYQSQTHYNYKTEERSIKTIVLNNTKCVDERNRLQIIFYYRNNKTHNLVMKNNMAPTPSALQQCNVIYKFQCPLPHSKAETYIGLTQTTLSRRLTMHGQNGSIFNHFEKEHNSKPTRNQLTENTNIITRANNRYMLAIKEALLILKESPSLNVQFDNFENILKLHSSRNLHPKTTSIVNGAYPPPPSPINQPCLPPLPAKTSDPLPKNQDMPTIPTPIHRSTQESTRHSSIPDEQQITSLPDFGLILSKFNIDFSRLKPVALENYRWWEFQECHVEITPPSPIPHFPSIQLKMSTENILIPPIAKSLSQTPKCSLERSKCDSTIANNSPTISQRIRTMRRRVRGDSFHKPDNSGLE